MAMPSVTDKSAAVVRIVHGAAKSSASHALAVLYIAIGALVVIPLASVVWTYWHPTVAKFAMPAADPPAKQVRAKQ